MEIMEIKTNEGLLRALFAAKARKSTPQELREQRVSFIYGCLGGSSNVTRERIQNVLDEQDGKVAA
jgi:hypothetical protein